MEVEDERLFNYAIKGQWRKVVEAFKNNPEALEAKITKSEDTVIHIAIYVGQTSFVTALLDKINDKVCKSILCIQNSKGNTPLHLAAQLGHVEICTGIATRYPNLISCRNFDGETPMYLAAEYGKKDAFFCLYGYQQNKEDYSPCRKSSGDTILHSTIFNEYFDVAFQILHLYPDLADSVNEDGLSPLHMLARKPNCFKSSTRMESLDLFIYHCLMVDDLKEEIEVPRIREDRRKTIDYPKNYETCMDMSRIVLKMIRTNTGTNDVKGEVDEENPSGRCLHHTEQARRKKQRKKKMRHHFPPNWETLIRFIGIMIKAFLIVFGGGASWIRKIQRKKEKHVWAKQVMEKLVHRASQHRYAHAGGKPGGEYDHLHHQHHHHRHNYDHIKQENRVIKEANRESPLLMAAKMGVTEMVERILDSFPVSIQDVDAQNKNVVLLAIENRQPHVFNALRNRKFIEESAFRQVDAWGNSALHLAAVYKEHKPWRVPGAAMQMQWEYKWYKLVKQSMPPNFFARYNCNGQTAKQMFVKTHAGLVKEGSKWLTKTAESCSVVAALVATVAFTTSTAIPGGSNQETGVPLLRGKPLFSVFTVASLVALCTSVTALVLFLSILTSRFQEKDFAVGLPRKLLLGLSSLFTSIAAVLISFCAGHFFIVEAGLRVAVYPIYVATFLPVTFFAFVQLPLYFDLALAIIRKVPQRSYKVSSH